MNKKILELTPYMQGVQPETQNSLKLNTNENPYHTKIEIVKNIIKEIKFFGNKLKFYPDPNSKIIKYQICAYYNIKIGEVFIGNGSDDVLANIFLTFLKNKKILYILDLTYSFYESFIKLYKIKYKIIKINKNFSINLKNIKNNKNIIINNPNAPTGKFIKNLEIKIILKNTNNMIIVDETYIDFENRSLVKIIKNKKNIIITQTFSKFRSMAGLRIGFAIGNKKLIDKMDITKNSLNSYPINIISQISIKNLIKNNIFFEKIKKKILKSKSFLKRELKKIKFNVIKSESNFILITKKSLNINKLLKYLNKKNIFVRKFEIPKIENYMRITIGKLSDSITILNYINNFLQNYK